MLMESIEKLKQHQRIKLEHLGADVFEQVILGNNVMVSDQSFAIVLEWLMKRVNFKFENISSVMDYLPPDKFLFFFKHERHILDRMIIFSAKINISIWDYISCIDEDKKIFVIRHVDEGLFQRQKILSKLMEDDDDKIYILTFTEDRDNILPQIRSQAVFV